MKKSVFLLLACFFIPVNLEKVNRVALDAISNIINSDFATFSSRIDFLTFGESSDLFDRLLRRKNESLSLTVKHFGNEKVKLDVSSVLIFGSLVDFKENIADIRWKTHESKNYRHLAYIPNATAKDIEESVKDGWSIDSVAFLLNETEKSIDLATSFMFTKEKCRQNQLVTINRFKRNVMKWETDNFFPEKYENLHSCSLSFLTLMINYDEIIGLNKETLNEMSREINFKIDPIYAASEKQFFFHVNRNHFDFYDFLAPYHVPDWIHIFISSEKNVYIVPPGEPLTQLEKLLSPFDRETWIGIVTTLTTTLVAIQIVSFTSRKVKHWSFGRAVGSLTMNLLNVFLCGSQTKVPKKSTARYVFLSFLIWSMIIRTCFQSLSYRALQLDNRHSPAKSFEDIFANNFTQFIAYDGEVPANVRESVFYR